MCDDRLAAEVARKMLAYREVARVLDRLERPMTPAQVSTLPRGIRNKVRAGQQIRFGKPQVITIGPKVHHADR